MPLNYFILMLIISMGSGIDRKGCTHQYLWPISDRFIAMTHNAIRIVEMYAGLLLLYSALILGTWLMKGSDQPSDEFMFRFTPENLTYLHLRVIVYGMIICWIYVGFTGLGSVCRISSQGMLFMIVAVTGLYLTTASRAWAALIFAVLVVWSLSKFRQAWREGDIVLKTIRLFVLIGAGLLALGLVLPPFSSDLRGWNILVACEVIFLMISPFVIAPMNVNQDRHI